MAEKVAVLYQAQPAPIIEGVMKPMKPNGYADSGADIAFSLRQSGHEVITPIQAPQMQQEKDWVFPDTVEGINSALECGANVLWLNTVLYQNHPIERFRGYGLRVIGQEAQATERFDDKYYTNKKLSELGLAALPSVLLTRETLSAYNPTEFPIVIKPIRGRGSQGVHVVKDAIQFQAVANMLFESQKFGDALMIEPFLAGQEITVTVMPPGKYKIGKENKRYQKHWTLPPVTRFNQIDGVAPYNGIVPVVRNSSVISQKELQSAPIQVVLMQCMKAAEIIEAKAPIRIDCRADEKGDFWLFDVNMKPNITGPGRPGREEQDSLISIAAHANGWNYPVLVANIANQCWEWM